MEMVRYGIIGLGNMGSGHVNTLFNNQVPGAKLTAVCDINPAKIDWAKTVCGDSVAYFDNHTSLLDSGLVDAILIATPHYFHPIIGMEAFSKKIHVLSEKPIGVYTKIIRDFMESAKNSGCAFGIMYNQRTNTLYQKMRELVQSGELGELKRCLWIITDWYRTQAYYNSGGWRATWAGEGGGVLINQCPHNLDLWQWIFGMPSKIRAFCSFGKYHDIEVEDDVTAYAEYPNGATGMFITTTGEYPGTNRLEITGSKGKLVCEKGQLTFWKLKEDEREFTFTTDKGFASIANEKIEFDIKNTGEEHKGILKNFTNHILNGEELLAPGYEGINGLSISNAMMLSTWKNATIDLPNDGEDFYAELQKRIAESSSKKAAVDEKAVNLDGTYGS
jgi:Predicted dehydrogenases and related proteins